MAKSIKNGARKVNPKQLQEQAETGFQAGSIEDRITRMVRTIVPERERGKLPKDLADNFDHYMYGTPKQR